MPRHLLRQVVPGITKAEVRDILGEPAEGEDSHTWVYQRWGNAGWVEVCFDEDGAVVEVNDESVFPPTTP
ncbi:MAG: hypothetical protein HQ582_28810 [Planctomycetes bacterium]|nr:hypothetical protein [Planctomycetota bacterium]